jgi:hypothetical protein
VTVQSPEAAAARKREWDALTPKMRDEMQDDYQNQLERRERWVEWLQENRWRHAACGGALYGLPAAFIFGMIGGFPLWALPLVCLVDIAAGCGLGFALNRLQGGPYRGMGLFAAGFILETIFRVGCASCPVGIVVGMVGSLMLISGFLISLCTGYALGLQLTLDRSDLGA